MASLMLNLIKPEIDRLPCSVLYIAEQGWAQDPAGKHGPFGYSMDDPRWVHHHVEICKWLAGTKVSRILPNVYADSKKAIPTDLYLPILDTECVKQGVQWCVQIDKGAIKDAITPEVGMVSALNYYQHFFTSPAYAKDGNGRPIVFEFGCARLMRNWNGFTGAHKQVQFICQQRGVSNAPISYAWINPFPTGEPTVYLEQYLKNSPNGIPCVWRAFNDESPTHKGQSVWGTGPARVHKAVDAQGVPLLKKLVDTVVANHTPAMTAAMIATYNDREEGSAMDSFLNFEYDLFRWPNIQR